MRVAMASAALLVWAITTPALAAIEAGVAAAVRGSVTLDRSNAIGLRVESGTPIFLGDSIKTSTDSGLQILLRDETVFTLGPSSELLIDEFVYDPGQGEGKLDAELVRGAFRFISGRIAKKDPDAMKVRLPSGTIGIRGTVVETLVDPLTGKSLVILASPGTPDPRLPAIQVSNEGVSQGVKRGGWGVEIPSFGAPPGQPFLVPTEVYDRLRFHLSGASRSGASRSGASRSGASRSGASRQGSGTGSSGGTESETTSGDPTGDGTSDGTPDGDGSATGTSDSSGTDGGSLDPYAPLGDSDGDTFDLLALDDSSDTDLTLFGSGDSTFFEPQDPNTIQPTEMITSVSALLERSIVSDEFFHYDGIDLSLASGGNFDLFVSLDLRSNTVGVSLLDVNSQNVPIFEPGFASGSIPIDAAPTDQAKYFFDFIYNASPSGAVPSKVAITFVDQDGVLAGAVKADVGIGDPMVTGSDSSGPITLPQQTSTQSQGL